MVFPIRSSGLDRRIPLNLLWTVSLRRFIISGTLKKKETALVASEDRRITLLSFDRKAIVFSFRGSEYTIRCAPLALLSLFVGLIGGIYGIGGGAFMSPVLVSFFHLPVYVVAGATLLSTAIASLAGVLCFSL